MKRLSYVLAAVLGLLALSACSLLQEPEAASGPITAAPLLAGDTAVFTIIPGESSARFELEEDLRSALTGWGLGARITVVGETDQVTGEFALDVTDLQASQVGEIRINARTLETGEFYRNRAIRNQILNTDLYEYITFQPTDIEGLPDSATVGDSVTFTLTGDLTIRDVTRQETFAVTATLVSPTEIVGSASTVIEREAYALTIPNVANVTYVEEAVELYIDFTARHAPPLSE